MRRVAISPSPIAQSSVKERQPIAYTAPWNTTFTSPTSPKPNRPQHGMTWSASTSSSSTFHDGFTRSRGDFRSRHCNSAVHSPARVGMQPQDGSTIRLAVKGGTRNKDYPEDTSRSSISSSTDHAYATTQRMRRVHFIEIQGLPALRRQASVPVGCTAQPERSGCLVFDVGLPVL